jgi:creatinine amidohydrolase
VNEILESFKKHGFQKFLFVNGHGGNIPTLTAAFSELKFSDDRSVLELINWWKLPDVVAYEEKHFGNENGFHATVGEVSVTMHQYPEAFKSIPRTQFKIEHPKTHWPLSPTEFREVYFDGRMGSNPGLATAQHGQALFEIATHAVVRKLSEMEA